MTLFHFLTLVCYSFNGAKYDHPLILQHVYKYVTVTKGCTVKTFKKGTIVNSGNLLIGCGGSSKL